MNTQQINQVIQVLKSNPLINKCEHRPESNDIYVQLNVGVSNQDECYRACAKIELLLESMGVEIMWNDDNDYLNEGSIML